MKKIYVVMLCFMPTLVFGQIKFNRSYDINHTGWGDIRPDFNGAYFCQSNIFDTSSTLPFLLITRFDSVGNIIDTNRIQDSNTFFTAPIPGQIHFDVSDSTFFSASKIFWVDTSSISSFNNDACIIKQKANGDTLWTNRIKRINQEIGLIDLQELNANANFLFAGIIFPDTIYGVAYSYLISVDTGGIINWEKIYGDSLGFEFATSVFESQNGGLVLAGVKWNSITDIFEPQACKLDTSGNVLSYFRWTDSAYSDIDRVDKSFGMLKRDIPTSVRPDCYIGYFLLDSTKSTPTGPVDFIYVRLRGLDSNFNTVWSKSIKRNDYYVLEHISLLNNGDMMITGSIENPVTNNIEGWVVVMDSYGIIKWERRYNKFNNTKHCLIHGKQTSDGGYILMGYTDSMDLINNAKPWLIKVDSLGCEDWSAPGCSPVNVTNYSNHEDVISVYPNPTSGILHIEFTPNLIGAKMKFELRDLVGKVVFQQVLSTSSSKCITALPFTLPDGNYTAHCIGENGFFYSTKLRIQQ